MAIDFDGRRYHRHASGYYRFVPTRKQTANGIISTALHRDIWQHYNGPIPDGHEIHHMDHDKGNNDLSNLQCLSRSEHKRLHGPESGHKSAPWHQTEAGQKFHSITARKQWVDNHEGMLAKSMAALPKAREAAKEWHGSPEGIAWHSAHGKKAWENRKLHEKTCAICSQAFTTYWPNKTKYCGPNCGAKAFRRRAKRLRLDSGA